MSQSLSWMAPKSQVHSHFLDRLGFDCRAIIYKIIVSQELHISLHDPEHGPLSGLAQSCTFLRHEIEQWYSLHQSQNWLTKMQPFKLGIFAPESTFFHLFFDYRPLWEENLSPRQRHEARWRWAQSQERINQTLELEKIQHLVLHRDSLRGAFAFGGNGMKRIFQHLTNLKSIEFVIHGHVSEEKQFFCCRLWELWVMFCSGEAFCHPKDACSCCSLPEMKWTVQWEGEVYSGFAPNWYGLARKPCDWLGRSYVWTVSNKCPDIKGNFVRPGHQLHCQMDESSFGGAILETSVIHARSFAVYISGLWPSCP